MNTIIAFVIAIGMLIAFSGGFAAGQGDMARAFLEVGIGATISLAGAAVLATRE